MFRRTNKVCAVLATPCFREACVPTPWTFHQTYRDASFRTLFHESMVSGSHVFGVGKMEWENNRKPSKFYDHSSFSRRLSSLFFSSLPVICLLFSSLLFSSLPFPSLLFSSLLLSSCRLSSLFVVAHRVCKFKTPHVHTWRFECTHGA